MMRKSFYLYWFSGRYGHVMYEWNLLTGRVRRFNRDGLPT